MIQQCDDSFIPAAVEYIGSDKVKCPYLYADILQYRTQGENFNLWVLLNKNAIQGLVYRYYDTIHLYCKDELVVTDMGNLINGISPNCISGEEWLIEKLIPQLKDPYRLEIQHIVTIDHMLEEKIRLPFVRATESDVPELAAVMMEDKVFYQVYTYDNLCRQMKDGISTGQRRVYILKDRLNKVLASISIYAETSDIVILGGLIVSQRAKGRGFGPIALTFASNLLLTEGKQIAGFVNIENDDSVIMHKEMGFKFIGKHVKLLNTL